MPVEYVVLLFSLVLVGFIPFLSRAYIPRLETIAGQPNEIRPKRSSFFDMLRGVAIIGVVVIHITYFATPYVSDLAPINNLTNNLLRFALPVFFVSSGVLLVAPKLHLGWLSSFYYRRFVALGIPYILVTIALGLYYSTPISEIWYNILTGNASVPLYFVPVLFQLYLLYPFIYNLAQRQWFVWVTLIVSIFSYLEPTLRFWQDLSYATPYVFFFAWGMYMRTNFQQHRITQPVLPWLAIIAMFVALQLYFGVERFYNGQYFYGLAMIMLLWWLYTKELVPTLFSACSQYIGRRSLWIFLTHFVWLQLCFYLLHTRDVLFTGAGAVLFVVLGLVGSVTLGIGMYYLQSLVISYISNSERAGR